MADSSTGPDPRSLYERLGGVYAIAAVMDDFIDRVKDNPRLSASLGTFSVPKQEQVEIFTHVDSTKADIVVPARPA